MFAPRNWPTLNFINPVVYSTFQVQLYPLHRFAHLFTCRRLLKLGCSGSLTFVYCRKQQSCCCYYWVYEEIDFLALGAKNLFPHITGINLTRGQRPLVKIQYTALTSIVMSSSHIGSSTEMNFSLAGSERNSSKGSEGIFDPFVVGRKGGLLLDLHHKLPPPPFGWWQFVESVQFYLTRTVNSRFLIVENRPISKC